MNFYWISYRAHCRKKAQVLHARREKNTDLRKLLIDLAAGKGKKNVNAQRLPKEVFHKNRPLKTAYDDVLDTAFY